MANLVQDVMTRNPQTLRPSSTIEDAARVMRDSRIGIIPVVDEKNKVRGIVTDRDLVVRGLAAGSDPHKTTVEAVCSRNITALKPTETTEDAVRVMREKAVRRLPVVDGNGLVGIVSLGDLAKTIDKQSALGQISAAPPNN